MKNIKKIAQSKLFGSLMSLLILFATSHTANATTVDLGIDTKISGEQMFREIFFFQGGTMSKSLPTPVQSKISSINKLSRKDLSIRDKSVDDIVAKIKVQNASYFNDLKKSISSKNPYAIKEQMNRGAELIMNVLKLQDADIAKVKKLVQNKKINLENDAQVDSLVKELEIELQSDKSLNIQQGKCAVYGLVLAVVAVAVVGVAVAVGVFIWVVDGTDTISKQSSSLEKDQYVQAIILNYA